MMAASRMIGELHEEITLFLYPTFVQVQHDDIRRFVSVRDIRHEGRIDRVAAVAAAWVIEVDHIELHVAVILCPCS